MVVRRYRMLARIALALGVVAVIAVAVARNGAYGSLTHRKFGLLGGYLWDSGPVRSIEARWRVPAVLGGPRGAEASTWVGAQQGFGSSAPFVQVGTLESSPSVYAAFWTDTLHHFQPQVLGFVPVGDEVAARIVRTASGWRLTIDDLTQHVAESASSTDGRGTPFSLGEWFQEDPSNVVSHVPAPYPRLSTVSFQRLRLNDRPPPYRLLYTQWLSMPGQRYLAPTPLVNDAFAMRPAVVSHTGARYLSEVAPFDAAYYVFLADVDHWTSRTSANQAAAQAAVFARTAMAEDRTLATQQWPPARRALVAEEIAHQHTVIADLNMVRSLTPAQRPAWHQRFLADLKQHSQSGHLVRRALRIPEYIP
jgi:hypothetical protein